MNYDSARMSETAILEDLRDFEEDNAEHEGKPLLLWEQVIAELDLD